jgi:hypothetical protein
VRDEHRATGERPNSGQVTTVAVIPAVATVERPEAVIPAAATVELVIKSIKGHIQV